MKRMMPMMRPFIHEHGGLPTATQTLARICSQFIFNKMVAAFKEIEEKHESELEDVCVRFDLPSVCKIQNFDKVCKEAMKKIKSICTPCASAVEKGDDDDHKSDDKKSADEEKDEKDEKKDKDKDDEKDKEKSSDGIMEYEKWHDDLKNEFNDVNRLFEYVLFKRLCGIVMGSGVSLPGEARRKLRNIVKRPAFEKEFVEIVKQCLNFSYFSIVKALDATLLGQCQNGYEAGLEHICAEHIDTKADMWSYESCFELDRDFRPRIMQLEDCGGGGGRKTGKDLGALVDESAQQNNSKREEESSSSSSKRAPPVAQAHRDRDRRHPDKRVRVDREEREHRHGGRRQSDDDEDYYRDSPKRRQRSGRSRDDDYDDYDRDRRRHDDDE